MDSIGEMQMFRAVAEAGGISAGARLLKSSAPAISRRLAALEARLGVRLVERGSRRFRLTEEGRLYFERSATILNDMRDAEAEVSARGQTARGLLRVGAPTEFGRRYLARFVAAFAAAHPGLEVHLVLSDMGFEVSDDGLDVALRIGQPDDQALMTRRLLATRRLVCGSPAYFSRSGVPQVPGDLAQHNCLRLARRHRLFDRWPFQIEGDRQHIAVTGSLSSSSGEVLHGWALAGEGLSLEAMWDVREDLASGKLTECLADYWCDEIELFATFAPGKPVSLKIRLFVDFIAENLARSWQAPA